MTVSKSDYASVKSVVTDAVTVIHTNFAVGSVTELVVRHDLELLEHGVDWVEVLTAEVVTGIKIVNAFYHGVEVIVERQTALEQTRDYNGGPLNLPDLENALDDIVKGQQEDRDRVARAERHLKADRESVKADRAGAEQAKLDAQGFAQSASDDAAQTADDRRQTGEDRVSTAADVVTTTSNKWLAIAAADRSVAYAVTPEDVMIGEELGGGFSARHYAGKAAKDKASCGLYKQGTSADAETTAADRVATSADRVQTGLDAVQATEQAGIATTKANEAGVHAQNAADATGVAINEANRATAQANKSENFANDALAWAQAMENIPVVEEAGGPLFSAYHWAIQSQRSADNADSVISSRIVQNTGQSTTSLMSQKAVSDSLSALVENQQVTALSQTNVDFSGASLLTKNRVTDIKIRRVGTELEVLANQSDPVIMTPPADAIPIYDAEMLLELAQTPSLWDKKFYLANDIDMSNHPWTLPIGSVGNTAFTGEFYGNGFNISNVSLSVNQSIKAQVDNGTVGTRKRCSFFGHCSGAKFYNMTFDGFDVVINLQGLPSLDGRLYLNIFGDVDNCTFYSTSILNKRITEQNVGLLSARLVISGLFGVVSSSSITHCLVDGFDASISSVVNSSTTYGTFFSIICCWSDAGGPSIFQNITIRNVNAVLAYAHMVGTLASSMSYSIYQNVNADNVRIHVTSGSTHGKATASVIGQAGYNATNGALRDLNYTRIRLTGELRRVYILTWTAGSNYTIERVSIDMDELKPTGNSTLCLGVYNGTNSSNVVLRNYSLRVRDLAFTGTVQAPFLKMHNAGNVVSNAVLDCDVSAVGGWSDVINAAPQGTFENVFFNSTTMPHTGVYGTALTADQISGPYELSPALDVLKTDDNWLYNGERMLVDFAVAELITDRFALASGNTYNYLTGYLHGLFEAGSSIATALTDGTSESVSIIDSTPSDLAAHVAISTLQEQLNRVVRENYSLATICKNLTERLDALEGGV